jgi:hypothetical protein
MVSQKSGSNYPPDFYMENTMRKYFWASSLATGALAASALLPVAPAQAAIVDKSSAVPAISPDGPPQGSPLCLNGSVGGATECIGSYLSNFGTYSNDVTNGDPSNLASKLLATGVFGGITDWTFDGKDDSTSSNPASTLGFVANGLDATTGTFGFTSGIDWANTALAISLKAATRFSIYYIPKGTLAAGTTSINWNTLGVSVNPNNGNPRNLSHASVYFNQVATPPTAVPTPALLPGLIGLGVSALRSKRKAVAQ